MTIDPENAVRLFGTSGLLVQDELRKVEKEHSVKLRPRSELAPLEHDPAYYPQFELKVRDEAAHAAKHYEVFYCLERTIRRLISTRMQEAKGPKWWDDVPANVRDEVKKNQERERDSAVTLRSDDPLDYTTFGQLGDIMRAHFAVFEDTFTSPGAMTRVMGVLNTLRGPIAHCSALSEDEVLRLRLAVRDWFRLME